MKISELVNDTVTFPVRFGETFVDVTYRPHAYNAEFAEKYARSPLWEEIPALVTDWEITGDNGVKVPLTADDLKAVPTAILHVVYNAVMVHIRAGSPGKLPELSAGT